MLALVLTACSSGNDDDDPDNPGEGDGVENLKDEEIYKKLIGEWICYYQSWVELDIDPYPDEAYYNTDDLTMTFNEDLTGYLKSEGSDELLEESNSHRFTYKINKQTIYADCDEIPWLITSLTDTELHLKWKDGDYIIIAKFVRRAPLSGKVANLYFKTEYNNDNASVDNDFYSFSYDFRGELNGIAYNNNSKLTFGPYQNGERFINWYNGDKLKLVDKDKSSEVFFDNSLIASAQYDDNGYLVAVSGGNSNIKYEYSKGNLSSWENSGMKVKYEYSKEKNDANIDLNYFIDYLPSQGHVYQCSNYLELGFNAKKSNNLVSKILPEISHSDVYFVYSYERDAQGRISKILRSCFDYFGDDLLNKCTISIEYYE